MFLGNVVCWKENRVRNFCGFEFDNVFYIVDVNFGEIFIIIFCFVFVYFFCNLNEVVNGNIRGRFCINVDFILRVSIVLYEEFFVGDCCNNVFGLDGLIYVG